MRISEKDFKTKKGGYTIIETMISVSLFVIIVVAGTGALLNANLLHYKSENMRSIMDNLSFIMEDMSRNIRTGYNYRCFDETTPWDDSLAQTDDLSKPRSCASGSVLAFEEAHGNPTDNKDQWVYKVSSTDGTNFDIYKSTTGGTPDSFVRLNTSEITIKGAPTFSVLGAEPEGTPNTQQPLVNIRLVGEINYKNVVTPFSLQTAVTQRLIDIAP